MLDLSTAALSLLPNSTKAPFPVDLGVSSFRLSHLKVVAFVSLTQKSRNKESSSLQMYISLY